MIALLADENLNNDLVRGLIRQRPDIDLVRVQDVGLANADDVAILDWAAARNRLVVTHDAATMIGFAYARVDAGLGMPGLIVVNPAASIAVVIEDLLLLIGASHDQEWAGQVLFVPLRDVPQTTSLRS